MNSLANRAALGAIAAGLLAATPATAQLVPGNSYPAAVMPDHDLPLSQDVDYPGTLKLHVDATGLLHKVYRVKQTIPVAKSGDVALLLPDYIPGNHGPRSQANRIAELVFKIDGKTVPWIRNPVHTMAYHLDVPEGARTIEASFTVMGAHKSDQGRVEITDEMINLQWEAVALYPAGYYTRRIPIIASVTWPKGWKQASALEVASQKGDTVTYQSVNYEQLQDSPVAAGAYYRRDQLGENVWLDSFAEKPEQLVGGDKLVQRMRNLVDQSDKLYGARHFDRYHFLNFLSDDLGGIGLEHHQSTEISSDTDFFTDMDWNPQEHQVFPHEIVHSWNGKYRRGIDLFTPDFHTPMRNSYLWMYEGQTMFWGWVLDARAGLSTKQGALDALALYAHMYAVKAGRSWRPLLDTTNDPIILQRKPMPWPDLFRNEDYYVEGLLIWLEADAIMRNGTNGARGLDDFAKAFFGMNDGDWGVLPYDRAEIIAKMNDVYAYDWASFLRERVDRVAPQAPLAGITLSGYELRYLDEPNGYTKASLNGAPSFLYSLEGSFSKEGVISSTDWNGPIFKSGLMDGDQVMAVGQTAFSLAALEAAVRAKKPIPLTVKRGERVWDMTINYSGGMRYPHLVKVAKGDGPLDRLLMPR